MVDTTTVEEWIGRLYPQNLRLDRHVPYLFEEAATSGSLAGPSTPTEVFIYLLPLMNPYDTMQARLWGRRRSTGGKQSIQPPAAQPLFQPSFPPLPFPFLSESSFDLTKPSYIAVPVRSFLNQRLGNGVHTFSFISHIKYHHDRNSKFVSLRTGSIRAPYVVSHQH